MAALFRVFYSNAQKRPKVDRPITPQISPEEIKVPDLKTAPVEHAVEHNSPKKYGDQLCPTVYW